MMRRLRHWPRLALTLIPLALALAHLGGWVRLPWLDSLDAFIYDVRLRATASTEPDPRIVIVDIDDSSLQKYGQWPWPRDRLARLTQELSERQRVAVLGFDVMFVEHERDSGQALLQTLRQSPWAKNDPSLATELDRLAAAADHDQLFANALKVAPAVLGFYFSSTAIAGARGALPQPVLAEGSLPSGSDQIPLWNHYAGSLPQLAAAAPSGFVNVVLGAQADGVVRAVPLLAHYQGGSGANAAASGYYESLALAIYRRWMHAQPAVARTREDGVGDARLQSLWLQSPAGARDVPVDASGNFLVPYRAQGGPRGRTFRYIAASDVLDGNLADAELAGKAVLIGTSAPGLQDLRSTPMDGAFPGVEIHANVLSALVDGRFLTRPSYAEGAAAVTTALLIGALLLGLIWLPATTAIAAVAVALLSVLAAAYFLYVRQGLVLPLAGVLVSVSIALALNLAWSYFVEARTRRGLARLFGSYVPPQLVDEMLVDPDRYTMRAESKELTVMFCDMRGFTRLSETMAPAQLQPLLNSIFNRLATVINRHRGTVDKYMGDCVMAFWGAPLDTPDHAELAVRAAHDMVMEIAAINAEHRQHGLPQVHLGIGVNTGVMHVGDMGSALRRSYTVIGDAVNLAARLEGLSEHYGVSIVAGKRTKEKASAYLWQELDQVTVKGKKNALTIYTPHGLIATASATLIHQIERWQALRLAYLSKQWVQARSHLHALVSEDDEKVLYRLYEQRLGLFSAQSPGPDWDGTEHFQAK